MADLLAVGIRLEPAWRRQPVRMGAHREIFVQCLNHSLGTFYAKLTYGPRFVVIAFGRIDGKDFIVADEAHISVLFFSQHPELRNLHDGNAWNWKELNAFLAGLEDLSELVIT